jgi:hypothetical protein
MRLRLPVLLPFLLIPFGLWAQSHKQVDRYAQKAPDKVAESIPSLVEYLTDPYETDLEKVRSIYIWIAYHITYDKAAYKKGKRRINRSNLDVLRRREAVCFGYSTLFEEMCSLAGIAARVVEGYPKNMETGTTRLDEINHAWNAVKIDSTWHLLDITWGSDYQQRDLEFYFLMSPEEMIQSHLPADPMWQLLDCPVPPAIFQKSAVYIRSYLNSTEQCFDYRDSIRAFHDLSYLDRLMKRTLNAYQFNPVKENEEAFGHAYMDYVAELIDQVDELERQNAIDSIKVLHLSIIDYCQKASRYIDLYDSQKENLAYSHMNYAVALSRELPESKNVEEKLTTMLGHFEKAQVILQALPTSFVIENSLEQLAAYIDWTKSY